MEEVAQMLDSLFLSHFTLRKFCFSFAKVVWVVSVWLGDHGPLPRFLIERC